MKTVFIMGSKGIPAQYGGFETFVDRLTAYSKHPDLDYYVTCLARENGSFVYNDVTCLKVRSPRIGSATGVAYDLLSLLKCLRQIRKENLSDCTIYILACRIGPFLAFFKRFLIPSHVRVFVNPDGHEWKRAKWSGPIRRYWKFSERLMVKHSDLVICDCVEMARYIERQYGQYKPRTEFIPYGAELESSPSETAVSGLAEWYARHQVQSNQYYLVVGRFVPENNYSTIFNEFMRSSSRRDLVVISNIEKNVFYNDLLTATGFNRDPRIKLVGTVYDMDLLRRIREGAFAYVHGHEVGGTNPSLVESLAATNLSLVLDVPFNREVAADAGVYFTKSATSLAKAIERVELLDDASVERYSRLARARIRDVYNWHDVVEQYEQVFLEGATRRKRQAASAIPGREQVTSL